jgi:hypothetical protein
VIELQQSIDKPELEILHARIQKSRERVAKARQGLGRHIAEHGW